MQLAGYFENEISYPLITNYTVLYTVQAYGHAADTWSSGFNMNKIRWFHKSVAIKKNLLIIGGFSKLSCEIYDKS